MSLFSSFALEFGALLALMALISAWLFRTASASLWMRIAIPAVMVALACYSPWRISALLGYPADFTFSALPETAELVAFVPHDEAHTVDLWLRVGETPRAYEVPLTANLKKTLGEANQAQARGQLPMLRKGRGRRQSRQGYSDYIDRDPEEYMLDLSVRSTLPPKE